MRSPGFEPGSSAWQADVLDQTRLRPLILVSSTVTNIGKLFKFSENYRYPHRRSKVYPLFRKERFSWLAVAVMLQSHIVMSIDVKLVMENQCQT